ncbi:hypothetical protein, partial [Rhodoferax sp.]|uniref:hypothetical protein n=1 Tax=Rhodoferax sp. TaxID=50421 RepID=UPI0025F33FAC
FAVLGESRFLVGGQGQGVLLHLCRLVRDDNTNASHAPGRDLFSVALTSWLSCNVFMLQDDFR